MVSGITQRNSHEAGIAFFLHQTYLFFRRKFGIIYESSHFMSFKLFLCISSDLSVDIGSVEHGKQADVLTEKLFCHTDILIKGYLVMETCHIGMAFQQSPIRIIDTTKNHRHFFRQLNSAFHQ